MRAAIPRRNFDQSCSGARESASGNSRRFYRAHPVVLTLTTDEDLKQKGAQCTRSSSTTCSTAVGAYHSTALLDLDRSS